jgi:hypothetical protein
VRVQRAGDGAADAGTGAGDDGGLVRKHGDLREGQG